MGPHRKPFFVGILAAVAMLAPAAVRGESPTPHREFTRAPLSGHAGATGSAPRSAASPSACSDGAYSLASPKWTKEYDYYIKTSSIPSNVSSDTAVSKVRAAVANISRGDNDCGISANVTATADYQGSTSTSANMTTSGTCNSGDGKNVLDFGTLPSGYLALTCWWSSGSSIVEADLRLNKASYGWVTSTSGCSGKFMIEAVATHEFGHAFGLNHVSESSHANLTMSTTIYSCQNSESTLGLGDVQGLEAKY